MTHATFERKILYPKYELKFFRFILVSSSSAEIVMESSTINCWAWSIHPLIIWLRFLGVDFHDVSTASSLYHRWVILAYSLLCLLSHATGQISVICYFFAEWAPGSFELPDGLTYDTITARMNTIIDYVNYTIHGFGTHVIMLTVIRARWKLLSQIYQRLDNFLVEEHYIRLRRMSYLGIVYTIIVIIGLIAVTLDYHFVTGTPSTHRIFISFFSTLSTVYPVTCLLLFTIHCYASTLAFESIHTDVKRNEIQLMNGRQDVSQLILLFKEKHILACDTVDGINDCFGWQLLLSMTFYLVSIINLSFNLFGSDNHDITTPDITFILFVIVNLTVTCVAADCIQNKAEDAIKELLKLKCDEPLKGLQMQQLNSLISEMTYVVPKISAKGYFNVSRKLFPQVIGTTLTYFFILCQFEVSEMKLCSSWI